MEKGDKNTFEIKVHFEPIVKKVFVMSKYEKDEPFNPVLVVGNKLYFGLYQINEPTPMLTINGFRLTIFFKLN